MKAEATNKKMSQAECSKNLCQHSPPRWSVWQSLLKLLAYFQRLDAYIHISHPPRFYLSPVSHPWLLVLQGLQTCQNSNAPSKKNPHFHPNPYITPSFLDLPNKNKVTMKKEWPVLLLCRTVSGYPIVTHSVGPLILLFLWQDYSLWSLSPCGCTQEKGQIKEISVYPPDLSNQDVRNHWLS